MSENCSHRPFRLDRSAAGSVRAQDTLQLTVGQRGLWDTSISEVGQRAGIFKKHGLTLEILYTQGAGETQQAVIRRQRRDRCRAPASWEC